MSKSSPALGVIIVNYNAGPLLADCVSAVLASPVDLDVCVSDNGSADDSLDPVRERHGNDPRLKVLENGANLGFACGSNVALAHTRAPYVLFLNPDCIVQKNTLGSLVAFMDATPDAGMAGCVIRNPDGSEQKASRRRIPDPWTGLVRFLHLGRFSHALTRAHRLNLVDEPLPEQPVQVEAVSGSLMLVRRAALAEVGALDEGYFLHCEDLDWFARFARSEWKIYFVPDVEAVHHQGACSKGRPVRVEWHKHRGMVRFFRRFQAPAYPLPIRLLVFAGIWGHFTVRALVEGIRLAATMVAAMFARAGTR